MAAQLDALGLPYEHFDAVDGRARWDELSPTLDAEAFDRNTGRPALPGEVGVYHSHLEVWKRIARGKTPFALVLEDDVVFHDDFLPAIEAALEASDSWDMLKLNAIRAKQPRQVAEAGDYAVQAYLGPFTGFGGYLIKRELAARLVGELLPIRRPIDRELDRVHVHRFRHYGLEPFPSHVDDGGESTITGVRFDAVTKRPWYARLPSYADRMATLVGKAGYLSRN